MKVFIAAGLIALLIGLGVAAFQPLGNCGSWVLRDRTAAEKSDFSDSLAGISRDGDYVKRCEAKYGDRTPVVLGLGFLVVVASIGLVFAPGSLRPQQP